MLESSASNRRLRVIIEGVSPVSFIEGKLTLWAPQQLLAAAQNAAGEIESLAGRAALATVSVAFAHTPAASPTLADGAELIRDHASSAIAPSENMHEHPLVKHAINLLGARVVGVYPRTK